MPPRLWQAPALRCRTSSRPSVGRHRQRRSGTGNAGLPARVTEHGGRHAAQHHASHRQRTGGCPGRPLVVVVGPPGAGAAVAGRRGRLGGAAGHGSHRPADRAEQPGEPARTTQAPRPGRGRAAVLREIDLSPRDRGGAVQVSMDGCGLSRGGDAGDDRRSIRRPAHPEMRQGMPSWLRRKPRSIRPVSRALSPCGPAWPPRPPAPGQRAPGSAARAPARADRSRTHRSAPATPSTR